MKNSKISIVMSLFLAFFLGIGTFTYAEDKSTEINTNGTMRLSSMTADECLEFITDMGIEIPEQLESVPDLGELVKSIISKVETHPDAPMLYSYTVTKDFADKIKDVVNSYYGVDSTNMMTVSPQSTYTLVDSTLFAPWHHTYFDYNCYGHAINTKENIDPGYYSDNDFEITMSISQMADIVVKDLESLGFWGYYSSRRPTNLASWEKAIAIRKTNNNTDYHFMRLENAGWTHKVSWTAVLLWNYSNPAYKIWSNEAVVYEEVYPPTIWYDSAIQYIRYWPKGTGPEPEFIKDIMDINYEID